MVMKSSRFFLVGLVLVIGVLLGLNFVAAWVDCYEFGPFSTGGTPAGCVAAGCVVTSEDMAADGYDGEVIFDSQCASAYSDWCCLPKMCWQWDATSQEVCEANDGDLNCTWNGYPATIQYYNGSSFEINGTCHGDWTAMGSDDFGGAASGCWQYDGDRGQCVSSANSASCQWRENDANQNPWCWVHTLGDATMQNAFATTNDIGCCEQKGCWSYDGNESQCMTDGTFAGLCTYVNKSDDSWCPNTDGCCYTKMCNEIGSNETLCNLSKMQMMMPCTFNESGSGVCENMDGGGFIFFNDSDSCFNMGGWYDSFGDCVMPTSDGGGDFMFGDGAHCWFADNQPLVCGNITGCAYCETGGGVNGVDNSSINNICGSGVNAGWCEGHVLGDSTAYTNADNSDNLACYHIQIKSACNYGPLPNCVWNSSVNLTGAFCAAGATSVVKALPPVGFCEHPDSKNNYTLCNQLITEFMMPCTWDNSSVVVKNCSFNPAAVFGSSGETDLGMVGSDTACTASGGTWQTEYYIENDILKQDSWCEMTGFFSVDDGGGEGNKGNCDTSCWACEFQYNGSAWSTVTAAESACVTSDLGYCRWTNDSSSFSGFGWCDYPQEMELGGSGDCNTDCENCNFMNNPDIACFSSVLDCQWVNDSESAINGSCIDATKKICDNDCFSCYDSDNCYNSDVSCSWDDEFALCKPMGYDGEVCFNGVDDDGDGMVDCSDPDCGFDNFCGGSSFGGDCFAQESEGECNQTFAFELGGEDLNCTWVNNSWEAEGHCDMPGSNCWQYDSNLSACGEIPGCTNDSSSMTMGGSSMCDINMTLMDSSTCWEYDANETYCGSDGGVNCQWVNDSWCDNVEGNDWCDNVGGWCDFKPFATCMGLNDTACGDNSNCTWKEDSYSAMPGDNNGWCDVACFNPEWDEAACTNASLGGLCEYRNMSATCQPEMFMMMGMGDDGKSGCWQYDGNETGCGLNSVTCVYKNDTYANNNLPGEPAGWCMDKAEFEHFGDMKGGVIDLAMDSGNSFSPFSPPGAELGVSGEVDLIGMGMRVSDDGFNFGAGVFNISNAVVCNGYKIGAGMSVNGSIDEGTIGTGSATTKFYWYLDTDGSESVGCTAYGGSNSGGYDFMINYVSSNESGSIVETKQLMRCDNESWVATNALITTSKQMSCGEIMGVMIAIDRQGLEAFNSYDKTANMRIFMASANATDSRTSPSDYLGPGYYTPGMIDFGFVDCSDPNTKDPKCKNIQKFGFNVFEECMNGVDDDENGLADCDDPACLFSPKCASGGAFSFVANVSDKTAPAVMFSKIDKLSDGAFMKIDTNEPSNLSVSFYYNDSTCTVLNKTLSDVGIEAYQNYSNFKPFHTIDLINTNLGYALTNGTAYYYKIRVCDPSGNCGVSTCSNFTTKTSLVDKSFIFKMDLPAGYTVDIPALNKVAYNFTETFEINGVNTSFDVGVKTNTSVTKNMNMTVHSNCGDGLSIGFYGVNVFEPMLIDMSNAFVCDEDTHMMGMNSSLKKWNTLIDKMYLGGATDYIEMNMPVAYSASNTFNFVDDAGAGAQDVDDYVNCESGGTGVTACQVPVSLGF